LGFSKADPFEAAVQSAIAGGYMPNDPAIAAEVERRMAIDTGMKTISEHGRDKTQKASGGGKGKEVTQEDVLKSLQEQAKVNKEILDHRRDELKIRRELGVLTEDESRELERIERRIVFQEDKIEEATEAWREQVSRKS
jgi:hypothetical protein